MEFASTLAQRTRLIKDNLIENPQNPQISTLYQNFRDILYKDLDFESFCDSFAQTLTYALFLARLNNSTEPNATQGEFIDLYNAKKFIPKSFPLIRAMSGFLDNLDELDSLKWLIKEILSIINHIDPAQITLELNKIADKDLIGDYLHKDPYLHFYETFLSQYDPHLRELRGVYYTPFAVVSFIINAIDSTLKSDFGEAKGLGSALNNDNITLLDFATGTGTFLLQAFRKALESTPQNSLHYKPKNLLNRFSGFEFLIAPYTIAHLKISQSFKEEFNAPLNDNEKLNILLTNTIYAKSAKDEQNTKSNLFAGMYELALEFLGAQNLKEQQILIITGNPPYSGASANKGLYEDEVKIAYGLEPNSANLNSEAQRIIKSYFANPSDKAKQKDFRGIYEARKLQNEKNPKWLLDDYVKFIRFAESKIESQDSGIIAIISNNSFLDNPTFRGMRYHLLNTFDKIYILDLHGNARKKEVAPDGNKDDNVFDIMQGVCISVFVKLPRSMTQKRINAPHSVILSAKREVSKSSHPVILSAKREVSKTLESNKKAKSMTQKRINESDSNVRHCDSSDSTPCALDSSFASLTQNYKESESHNDNALAQIYHYDLYGKRKDKYAFLQGNGLESIEWSELAPKAPFYLFIPQNESLRAEYEKGISVKDMFKQSVSGVKTSKDSVFIATNESTLESQIKEYYNEFDKRFVQDIEYRPFDIRKIYYDSTKIERPRTETMKHFLGNDNMGLIYKRGFLNAQSGHGFVSENIIDMRTWSCAGMQGSDYIAPLYLKIENEPNRHTEHSEVSKTRESKSKVESMTDKRINKSNSNARHCDSSDSTPSDLDSSLVSLAQNDEYVENFTPEFRAFVDKKYGERFTPEQILGYIYAVLYHKDYREKYVDFLKIDFPKVPFVKSKKDFLALSALGCELVDLHLMRVDLSGESMGEPLFGDLSDKNEKIEKIAYNAESKRLFVNASLYFSNVSAEVWEYKIGGYAVLDKYLKSHKGENIDYAHFECVIKTLHKSLQIQSKIAKIGIE